MTRRHRRPRCRCPGPTASRPRPLPGSGPALRACRPRALRPARGHPPRGSPWRPDVRGLTGITGFQLFWWVILPYLALGHLRHRPHLALPLRPVRLDQPLDPASGKELAQVGQPDLPLRHLRRHRRPRHRHPHPGKLDPRHRHPRGRLPVVLRRCRHAGAVLVIIGVAILAGRRLFVTRVRATTSPVDWVALDPARHRDRPRHRRDGRASTCSGGGYDYRQSVALWFRGLFAGNPDVQGHRPRPVALPGARHRGVGGHRRVAVQPARARLELPGVVPVAALRRLPQPGRHPAQRAGHQRPALAQDRRSLLNVRTGHRSDPSRAAASAHLATSSALTSIHPCHSMGGVPGGFRRLAARLGEPPGGLTTRAPPGDDCAPVGADDRKALTHGVRARFQGEGHQYADLGAELALCTTMLRRSATSPDSNGRAALTGDRLGADLRAHRGRHDVASRAGAHPKQHPQQRCHIRTAEYSRRGPAG